MQDKSPTQNDKIGVGDSYATLRMTREYRGCATFNNLI